MADLPPFLTCPKCGSQAQPADGKLSTGSASVTHVNYRCKGGHVFGYSPITGKVS